MSDRSPAELDAPRRDRPARPRPALVARHLFFVCSAALIVWAGLLVPLPFVEYVPGTPEPIGPLVGIEGAEVTELDGQTAILTVLPRDQPVLPAIGALLDRDRTLIPAHELYPPGIDRLERREAERERFRRQFDVAAAVGARAAGHEAEIVTEAVVVEVVSGSAADGVLRPGDVVLAADGRPIATAEALGEVTRRAGEGDRLTLRIRRDGDVREITARLTAIPGEQGARLGVAVLTAVDELRLPFEVRLDQDVRIGGPSAGLMTALTVYDLLAEEDLLDGRVVHGTGTLDAEGRVGPIGQIGVKMRAAVHAGADLVLVPAAQEAEARAAAPDALEVVGVSTLDEALGALRDPA